MKVVRTIEVVLLVVAAVALTIVYFKFQEHFPWLIAGFGIGFLVGALLTVLVSRGLRKKKKIPAPESQKTV